VLQVSTRTRIYRSKSVVYRPWKVNCPGGHGICTGYTESSNTWLGALRKLSAHQLQHHQSVDECDICQQIRMCFPHRQIHVWDSEEHDCPSCRCASDTNEEIVYRKLCTSCWQRTPEILNETAADRIGFDTSEWASV
jgi:hypothetical protein